jgi:hypothetical protein
MQGVPQNQPMQWFKNLNFYFDALSYKIGTFLILQKRGNCNFAKMELIKNVEIIF